MEREENDFTNWNHNNSSDTYCAHCKLLVCVECITTCGNCNQVFCSKPACIRKPLFLCDCKTITCLMCINASCFFKSVPICVNCDKGCSSCKDCLGNYCCPCCKQMMCGTRHCAEYHVCEFEC